MAYPKGAPRPPGSGRAKGTPNKSTIAMREMFLEAFEKVGGVKYLVRVAEADPATFVRGLHRMIPNAIEAEVRGTLVNLVDLSDQRKDDDDGLAEG